MKSNKWGVFRSRYDNTLWLVIPPRGGGAVAGYETWQEAINYLHRIGVL